MVSIGPSASPEVVFTATFAGLYAFSVQASGSLELRNEGALIAGGSTAVVTYMGAADELTYQGPAAQLVGVRLGDDLTT